MNVITLDHTRVYGDSRVLIGQYCDPRFPGDATAVWQQVSNRRPDMGCGSSSNPFALQPFVPDLGFCYVTPCSRSETTKRSVSCHDPGEIQCQAQATAKKE